MGTLAATYSDMAYGHTTIGAGRFHFRVRNGIGWFPLAMAAREYFFSNALAAEAAGMPPQSGYREDTINGVAIKETATSFQKAWGYMVKPHGQLVLVS